MAFPHPGSRKDHCRSEDKPNSGGVVWNFVKWTIDITEYQNAQDDVNPAKDRTLSPLVHDIVMYDFVSDNRHAAAVKCNAFLFGRAPICAGPPGPRRRPASCLSIFAQ